MATIRELEKKDGTKVYHVEIRLRGHKPERANFRTKTQAKEWIQDTESAIRDGRYKGKSAARKHTVGEVIDRFIKQCVPPHPIYYQKKVQMLLRWKKELGSLLLRDLSPSKIAEVRDLLLSETTSKDILRSPPTVNRYMSIFSKVLSVASKEWELLDVNPFQKVRKCKESKGRDRCLSAEEKESLLIACKNSVNPYLYYIVSIALQTGMRYGEIINLRWEDLSFDLGYITLQHTKNGDKRVIPLTDEVIELFKDCPTYGEPSEELIFRTRRIKAIKHGISIRKSFSKALEEANIKNCVFHSLRHTAATDLANSGATEGDLREIFGWKARKMTGIYCHRSVERKRKLLELLGRGSVVSSKEVLENV